MPDVNLPPGFHWDDKHGTIRLLWKDIGGFQGMIRQDPGGPRVYIPAQDIGPFPSKLEAGKALVAMVTEMQRVKEILNSFGYLDGDTDEVGE